MMRGAARVLLVFLLVGAAGSLCAQGDGSPEASLAARAREAAQAGRWAAAIGRFDSLVAFYPHSHDFELYVFERAKVTYHSGDYQGARAGFNDFLARFPQSPSVPYAEYFRGIAALQSDDKGDAVDYLSRAWQHSQDKRLDELVAAAFAALDDAAVEQAAKSELPARLSEVRKCDLARDLGRRLISLGRTEAGSHVLNLCPGTPSAEVRTADDKSAAKVAIAVAVPLSGQLAAFGEQVRRGAVLAGADLTVDAFDTKGDPVAAGRLLRELPRLGYAAVIGPLTSDEAFAATAAAGCTDLPLLVPAATSAGLTELNGRSFQLAPNIALQGTRLAEYARQTLRIDTAVILTPVTAEPLSAARAFAARFTALGGTIGAIEYYTDEERDFGKYLRSVKKILLGSADSTTVYLDERGDTLELNNVPVSVGALFLPGTSEQLRQLLPQIRSYNLRGPFLGGDAFGDDAILSLGDEVTRGAVFASPYVLDTLAERYRQFARDYRARYDEAPTRLACLGYDAATLVNRAARAGDRNVAGLADRIGQNSLWRGTAGAIKFGKYRENVEMPLYRVTTGRPERILLNEPATDTDGQ